MFTKEGDIVTRLVTHLFMLIVVYANPCSEDGSFDPCVPKMSLTEELYPEIEEQSYHQAEKGKEGHKYDFALSKREMRDAPENFSGSEEAEDGVDRQDHFTQLLAEFLVNTDGEITSLEAQEVQDSSENAGPSAKEDGFFAFLTESEQSFEVEGVWSHPAQTIIDESEFTL